MKKYRCQCQPAEKTSLPCRDVAGSRRSFLITLGFGASAAVISGFLGIHALRSNDCGEDEGPPSSDILPMLNAGLVSQSDGETTLLRRQGVQEPVCAVNSVGWEVLRRLDGRHTVQDISVALAKDVGLVHDGELEGKIACFVATLGKFGLLHQPYFVHIVEKYA